MAPKVLTALCWLGQTLGHAKWTNVCLFFFGAIYPGSVTQVAHAHASSHEILIIITDHSTSLLISHVWKDSSGLIASLLIRSLQLSNDAFSYCGRCCWVRTKFSWSWAFLYDGRCWTMFALKKPHRLHHLPYHLGLLPLTDSCLYRVLLYLFWFLIFFDRSVNHCFNLIITDWNWCGFRLQKLNHHTLLVHLLTFLIKGTDCFLLELGRASRRSRPHCPCRHLIWVRNGILPLMDHWRLCLRS